MTYKTEFINAIKNSCELGIKEPVKTCIDSTEKYLDEETKDKISQLFGRHILSKPNVAEKIAGGCIFINSLFKPFLENLFDEELILTLGYTKFLGKLWFDTPFTQFKEAVDANKPRFLWNTHAWLTLPTLEVIDVTYYYTMSHVNPQFASYLPRIKMDHNPFGVNDKFVELHPILVGEDILHKIMIVKYGEVVPGTDEAIEVQTRIFDEYVKSGAWSDVR